MARKKVDPHALGYRFYRGYIYRQWPESRTGRTAVWGPAGEFIGDTAADDVFRLIDLAVSKGWCTRQLELDLAA